MSNIVNKNREFLFLFEANLSNPNGDPDQENKPRMDYETDTLLVSNLRRNRDVRDFLKSKGFKIFVDTLNDKKVPMDIMFEAIRNDYLSNNEKMEKMKETFENSNIKWPFKTDNYFEEYKTFEKNANKKKKQKKENTKSENTKDTKFDLSTFLNKFLLEIIKDSLIDIRLFGSAMAIKNITKTFTGPIQVSWGYSLHPVELVKSNSITSIMNDDASTFGKVNQVYYALISHYGTINKFAAEKTGMTEGDLNIYRKALIQSIMNNQTASKKGQNPLLYFEIVYKEDFDGYIGDLRRFIETEYNEEKPIRKREDINVDFSKLKEILKDMKNHIEKVIIWKNIQLKVNDQYEIEVEGIKSCEEDLLNNIKCEE